MTTATTDNKLDRISWVASVPFFLAHVACLLALKTGVTWELVAMAVASYYLRMFGVTAGYHRYFAHRTYKTGRVFQFLLAVLAQLSAQKGALWWAAHHRHHHRTSDTEEDIHSPARKGFWYSHVGWILSRRWDETNYGAIKDFARYPELVWLNKFHLLPAVLGMGVLYALGGLPWLLWGGIIPTVLLWHGTFTINSLSHIFGNRRYVTTDTSRNNFLLALLTMGEGWHNNHHFHQNTANQGWFWWEVDLSFYVLKVLSWLRVVKDLRLPSAQTKYCYLEYTEAQKQALKEEARFNMFRPPLPKPVVEADSGPMLGLGAPAPAPLLEQ